MRAAQRPYVICHMVPSLDGRIVTRGWKVPSRGFAQYELTAKTFHADAWMIGRISMEPYAGKARIPTRTGTAPIPRTDHVARKDARSYAIALDPAGKLRWKSASIDDEHVITILTEQVSDDYLTFLQAQGVSYLFGGRTEVNLRLILEKLRRHFGIKRLLLEGGGKINGSFLAADLIDELSILVAPVADGSVGTPSLIDVTTGKCPSRPLRLVSVEKRPGAMVWLRYKVRHG